MSEKIFCGSGFTGHTFDSGASVINIRVYPDDMPEEHVEYDERGKKFFNLNVVPKKTQEENKPSHYVTVDTYKKDRARSEPERVDDPASDLAEDDLPF